MEHVEAINRDDCLDRQWQLSSLWSVLAPAEYRSELWSKLAQRSAWTWRPVLSVYSDQDDATRMLMIGAALNAHVYVSGQIVLVEGEARAKLVKEWLESHPHEAEWLSAQGVTPEQARERHAEWMRQRDEWISKAQYTGLTPGG